MLDTPPPRPSRPLASDSVLRELAWSRLHGTWSPAQGSCLRVLHKGAKFRPEERSAFVVDVSKRMRALIVDAVLEGRAAGAPLAEEVEQVHAMLAALEPADARLAAVIEMRYFGGCSEAEIAAALGVTDRTVRRDWAKGRLLLMGAIAVRDS